MNTVFLLPKRYFPFFVVFIFALTVLLFSWGTLFRGRAGLNTPIWFDEAYNLQVSTTLVRGGVYATFPAINVSNGERTEAIIFDPAITTGPSVLFPGVWLSKIADASPVGVSARRVQFIFTTLFVLLLPLGLFLRSGNILVFIPATLVGIWVINYGYWAKIMTEVLGEGPGLVYLIAAILIAYGAVRTNRRGLLVVGGMLCALSVFAKLIFLLFWAGAFFWLLWAGFKKHSERLMVKDCLVFFGGFLGMVLAWQIYQIDQYSGLAPYFDSLVEYSKSFFKISGGPISKDAIGSAGWLAFTLTKWKLVWAIFKDDGKIFFSLIFSGLGICVLHFWKTKEARTLNASPWKAMLMGVLVVHVWFIFSSPTGWPRHYLPAWALLVVSLIGWFLEILFDRLPGPILNGWRKNIFAFSIIIVCLGVSLVRMTSPSDGALRNQYEAVKMVSEIESSQHPVWIAQMYAEEDIDTYALFADANVRPFRLETRVGSKPLCEMLQVDSEKIYAFLSRANPRQSFLKWKCSGSRSYINFIENSGGIRLEVCRGSQLVCGS